MLSSIPALCCAIDTEKLLPMWDTVDAEGVRNWDLDGSLALTR